MEFSFGQIGVIHTDIKDKGGPIQACFSKHRGEVELFEEYEKGLQDIEGFSHLILLYVFHQAGDFVLVREPFLSSEKHGVFAMRAPNRPNPIGISVVKLIEREGNVLRVEGVDMIDGSPLLDIKPYVPDFDSVSGAKVGWLKKSLDKSKAQS